MPKNKSAHILLACAVLFIFCFWLISFAQDSFLYNDQGKRNPFIPLLTADGRLLKLDREDSTTGLSIEGIIYDKQGISYAIVNGQIVKVGDEVNDYRVLKIEDNKVIFIKDGQPLEIELKARSENEA